MIGVAAGAVALGANMVFIAPVPAMFVVVVLVAVSGGLHLDGLADTADGLLSARGRERSLEIMKDSRVGVMGVAAVFCVLGLKFAALASMAPSRMWRAAVLAPIAGRSALLVSMSLLPYLRPEGGLAAVFSGARVRASAIWGLAALVGAGTLVAGFAGACAAAGAAVATLLFAAWVYRKIRGSTGDTLGASCEIAETAVMLILALRCWG